MNDGQVQVRPRKAKPEEVGQGQKAAHPCGKRPPEAVSGSRL